MDEQIQINGIPLSNKEQTTWINLKSIMLSERSQTQKHTNIWHSGKDKTTETEIISMVIETGGKGMSWTTTGHQGTFSRR